MIPRFLGLSLDCLIIHTSYQIGSSLKCDFVCTCLTNLFLVHNYPLHWLNGWGCAEGTWFPAQWSAVTGHTVFGGCSWLSVSHQLEHGSASVSITVWSSWQHLYWSTGKGSVTECSAFDTSFHNVMALVISYYIRSVVVWPSDWLKKNFTATFCTFRRYHL